jgi:phosphopantothenoylcysteine decarboxylase/phosphopantothenate--cysteine ligase
VRTPDILAVLGAHSERDSFTLVGFAAETERVIDNARNKRLRKNADIIVANDVSNPAIGFGSDENEIVIVTAKAERPIPRAGKSVLAGVIFDAIIAERTI